MRLGAWVVSNNTITTTGQTFTGGPGATQACSGTTFKTCTDWLATLHLRQQATHQPASRFWALQWHETTIFRALAVLLIGFCFWWIRRRLT
jgi:hypothetical protein